jgi:prepilin-type processing-associated H-X9-DG protein
MNRLIIHRPRGTDRSRPRRPDPAARRPPYGGFSLVEVLVVVFIIAALLAMLMPAISAVRARGQAVRCQAALRQIGVAAVLHQNEHRGYLPAAGWHWEPVGGVVNPRGLNDPDARRYVYYHDGPEKRPAPITVALAISMGIGVRLDSRANLEADMQGDALRRHFACPAQATPLSGVSQTSSEGWSSPREWSSYVSNESVLGRRHPEEFPDAPVGKATRVRSPSTVMLMMDGRPRNQSGDNYLMASDRGSDDTLLDFHRHVIGPDNKWFGTEMLDFLRHRWRANVLFVDGHVDSVPMTMTEGGLGSVGISKGVYR